MKLIPRSRLQHYTEDRKETVLADKELPKGDVIEWRFYKYQLPNNC